MVMKRHKTISIIIQSGNISLLDLERIRRTEGIILGSTLLKSAHSSRRRRNLSPMASSPMFPLLDGRGARLEIIALSMANRANIPFLDSAMYWRLWDGYLTLGQVLRHLHQSSRMRGVKALFAIIRVSMGDLSLSVGDQWGIDRADGAARPQILVSLSDVDDLPTRLAASGALATITASPDTCQTLAKLEMERHCVPRFSWNSSLQRSHGNIEKSGLKMKTKRLNGSGGDPRLVHRGVVCVRNLFANLDAKENRNTMSLEADSWGLVRTLVQTIK
ncbi:hypothetical protein JB92DRAFT_3092147 [Gautieria morchelliformis]|nr:hypothetical protein JB92DRAFT_3092147 [Gautieria morchelliformis]